MNIKRDEFELMLKTYTTREVAMKLGVSQQAIIYHAKKLGIHIPRSKKLIVEQDIRKGNKKSKDNIQESGL